MTDPKTLRDQIVRLAMTEPVALVEQILEIALCVVQTRKQLGLQDVALPLGMGLLGQPKSAVATSAAKPRRRRPKQQPLPAAQQHAEQPGDAPKPFAQPPVNQATPLGTPAKRGRGRPRKPSVDDALIPATLPEQYVPIDAAEE